MSTQIIGENLMKTKILSVILSAIILSTSAAILVGCGDEKESVAKIATSDGAATKIETVTEVATDEQGSTQIVEETRVIEETTATNSKSENSESSETKSNDNSSASKNNTNSANVKSNSNSSSANKTTNNTNSNKSSAKVTGGSTKSSTKPAKSSKPKSVAVTSVSLSKSSLSVTVGKSASFTVKVNPNNASNKDYVASTNNGNATVSCSGSTVTVKGISKGSCVVTVKSSNGKTAKCSVTVKAKAAKKPAKVTDDTVLSLSELHTDKSMKKICDKINAAFKAKGMTYDSSRNINNSGWHFHEAQGDWKSQSINSYATDMIEYFDVLLWGHALGEQVYDDGETSFTYYNDYKGFVFRCYYEKQSDGNYNIYFCYG